MSEIEPLDSPNRPASVPRRFGVGVLLILMTAFAILFGIMSAIGAPSFFFIVISGLICTVAVGQVLLFEGKRPRAASIVAGWVSLPPLCIVGGLFEAWNRHDGEFVRANDVIEGIVGSSLCFGLILGAPIAYACGTAVSGVFLFVERIFGKKPPAPRVELQLFTTSDLVLLQQWLKLEPLCLAWTRGEHASFADSASFLKYLNLPSPQENPQPQRLCLKAVAYYKHNLEAVSEDDDDDDGDDNAKQTNENALIFDDGHWCDERVIGYVELTQIDRAKRLAKVRRAIVDSDAPQRPLVSLLMLTALFRLMQKSYGVQQMIIDIPEKQVIERDCFVQLDMLFPGSVLSENWARYPSAKRT